MPQRAQLGGIYGSGVYADSRPQLDLSGAVGALGQALESHKMGVLTRLYMERAAQLKEREFANQAVQQSVQNTQHEEQMAAAKQQHEAQLGVEKQRLENEKAYRLQAAGNALEIAKMRAESGENVAHIRAGATEGAATTRANAARYAAHERSKGGPGGSKGTPKSQFDAAVGMAGGILGEYGDDPVKATEALTNDPKFAQLRASGVTPEHIYAAHRKAQSSDVNTAVRASTATFAPLDSSYNAVQRLKHPTAAPAAPPAAAPPGAAPAPVYSNDNPFAPRP